MLSILEALIGCAGLYDGAVVMSDRKLRVTRAGLAASVAALAEELRQAPPVLGLLGDNEVAIAIGQLAGWVAGKTVVPLPGFFSPAQIKHVLADAAIAHVLVTREHQPRAVSLGLATTVINDHRTDKPPVVMPGGSQIIYTSGSTGTPKGVKHGLDQIDFSARALAKATLAAKADIYLSVLPLPLLLETIAAICVPLIVGARTIFDQDLTRAIAGGGGAGGNVAAAFDRHAPTTTVLVPQVLMQWVSELSAMGMAAPNSMRLVAVGGAPVAPALANQASRLGIPVYEGYGLSECCSVVALNRPNRRVAGTVGRPIEGLDVRIDAGEIVVDGPTIMDGYVGHGPAARPWRTGDLGHFDDQGNLVVDGRKDSLVVLSGGRNVSPEWIEAMLSADPRVMAAAVTGHGEPHLTAVIVPSNYGAPWFASAGREKISAWLDSVCSDAPAYAIPKSFLVLAPEAARAQSLFTGNGRIKRSVAQSLAASLRRPGEAA